MKFRVAQSNNLRGLLTEYGEVMGKGRAALNEAFPVVLARLVDRLPAVLIDTLRDQWTGLTELDKRISEIERRLGQWMKQDAGVKAIAEIPGVGSLTAIAAVATLGDANTFRIRPRIRGLDRLGSKTDWLRRQGGTSWHQQAGRHLPAHAARQWGTQRPQASERSTLVDRTTARQAAA